jgi:hypothetical protein
VSDRIDVVGIGNALVDVLSHESHEFVAAQDLTPGAMTLIDTARAEALYAACSGTTSAPRASSSGPSPHPVASPPAAA